MGLSILLGPYTRPPPKSKTARLTKRRRLCFAYTWPCRLRFSGGPGRHKKKSFKNGKFDKGGFFQTRECLKMLGSGYWS